MRSSLLALVILVSSFSAKADTVWNYVGNNASGPYHSGPLSPNPCNCVLDGSVTLDANNNAIAWNFTDGLFSLTNLNSTATISPDPQGPPPPGFTDKTFGYWNVDIVGANGAAIRSRFIGSVTDHVEWAVSPGLASLAVQANPGVWSEWFPSPQPTPEPASILLLGAGLLALLVWRRSNV